MAHEPRLAVESIAGQRPYQEDSVLAETLPDGRTLIAVADGMGGHAAGEVASALALETLVEAVGEGKDLAQAFALANQRVHAKATEPGKQGMGTTLVAVLVEHGEFFVANVGDSRGYVVTASGLRQLTQDHSFVAEAMRRGQSEEEAMATPWRDALTRSIGTEASVEVDVFGPFPLEDDLAFVICSDGLYKTLSDEDLQELFEQSGGARGAAQAMVTAAFDSGSDDNISVAIAEYGEVPRGDAHATLVLDTSAEAEAAAEAETEEGPPVTAKLEPLPSEDPGPPVTAKLDALDEDESAPAVTEELEPIAEGGSGGESSDALGAPGLGRDDLAPEESSLHAGLPLGALAAAVLLVGALIALLIFFV